VAPWLTVPALSVALAVAGLALVVAPEADTRRCTFEDGLVAEFTVDRRAEILEAIPNMGYSPELVDDRAVLENGKPAYPAMAVYHVALYRCLQADLLPILPGLLPGKRLPSKLENLDNVVIITLARDQTIYSDVDFAGLRIP
jgi:hypothetical protein